MQSVESLKDIKQINLDNHIFIEASAGTGKTYTITRIYLKYILEKNIDHNKIILLTFTNKATLEMLNRVRELILEGIQTKQLDFINNHNLNDKQIDTLQNMLKHFDQLRISTIHSFCKSLLNEFPYELNLPSNTEIINDNKEIIKQIIINKFLNPDKNLNIYLNKILLEKNMDKITNYIEKFIQESSRRENIVINFIDEQIELKDILNQNYSNIRRNEYLELLKLFYEIHERVKQYKKFHGKFTYDDLILNLYYALKNNESFKQRMQKQFKICIVDEFQDTDPYQWEIFKMIFIENNNNKIVVVGDPKQAIYGFRGADIYTYINAKKELEALNHKAKFYKLDTNYRSTKTFIEQTNEYFKICFNNNLNYLDKIEFYDISSPENYNNQNDAIYTKYKPVNFIQLESEDADSARKELSEHIVSIIKDLIQNKVMIYNKEKIEPVKYSDIAILVRTGDEANYIKNSLKKNNIPFIDYSKDNIFNSLEASAIELLLEYLANPQDAKIKKRFIVYYFIDIPYTNLDKIEENYSYIQSTISEWVNYLDKRNWYELFYKVIEDTKLYYKFLALPDYERKITNYEHLIEILVEIATKNHYGPYELYEEFKNLKESQEDIDDYNIRLESEEDKVHILTMHKSKGLEFPVVFLSGWFNYKAPSVGDRNNYKFYDDYNNIWNICFFYDNNNEYVKNFITEETFFEEFRLFYVGFTRAQSYLFLPKYDISNIKDFLSNLADKEKFNILEKEFFEQLKKETTNPIKINSLNNIENNSFKENGISIEERIQNVTQLEKIPYLEKRYILNSYSSLTKQESSTMDEVDYDEIEEISSSEEVSSKEKIEKAKTDIDKYLKPGAKTGNFIHKIFEKIDFMDFKKDIYNKESLLSKYKNLFNYYNQQYSIYLEDKEKLNQFLIDFIFEILNHKINNEFSLCEINPEFIKKEIGFLIQDIYSIDEFSPILNNNFFTGNLDLFFEHNNKYYLLDYKTSLLEKYDFNSLKEHTENYYKIQYLLYSYALYLWLNQIKGHSLKEKLPGGIIYYYIRGYKESSKGIYFKEFELFENIHKELKLIL